MLRHTFRHIPGIGAVSERRLWSAGILCWDDYLGNVSRCPLSSRLKECLNHYVAESRDAITSRNAAHFGELLPPDEIWRLYSEFSDSVAFVDIETTGLWADADAITVIGLFDGHTPKAFVKGINLDEFAEEIKHYSLMVTFNGKRFDVPFLRTRFGDMPAHQAHIDVMYPLRRLGYRGGLKSIEMQLGLEREGALKEVNGYLAVLLWREYRRGNRKALDTLVRYNLEDVVNLQYLTEFAYNEGISRLPIDVPTIPVHPKYQLNVPFDAALVERLNSTISYWSR